MQRSFAARLGSPSVAHPGPVRPGGLPALEIAPGVSRFQRHSAHLPSGVERFKGLGVETEIVVDLTNEADEGNAAKDRTPLESG